MEAKELFATLLSNDDMQAVINCHRLPVIEVNKQECQEAYRSLSATQRCSLRRRVCRYADAYAGNQTSEGREQYRMLADIKAVIM